MKRTLIVVGWLAEIAILIGLLWKHRELYDLTVSLWLLLLSPLPMLVIWLSLKKELKRKRITQAVRMRLCFLTWPTIFVCLSLLLSVNYELLMIRSAGGNTKEMGMALVRMAREKNSEYPDSIPQWTKYNIRKMKSDAVIYTVLLVSLCLLYGSRCKAQESVKYDEMEQ